MSLVNFDEVDPPYIIVSSSAPVDVATTTNFFYFQNLVASQRITKTSNTRITFQETGVYEFNFSTRLSVLASVASYTLSLQYGINGLWTTLSSGPSIGFISSQETRQSLILPVNANDYFELRSLISVSVSQNITHLCANNTNSTSSIKRIH
jgi:hypothetical protein